MSRILTEGAAGDGRRRVAVLGFHKVADRITNPVSPWTISADAFVAHLEDLRRARWQVIDVDQFLRALDAPGVLPSRTALLTFDDGHRSFRQVALPRLLQFGYPAVLFVPTRFIGGRNDFDAGYEPEEAICDWEDLRALRHAHVAVQSHGVSHARLSSLEPREQVEEIVGSKRVLETGLGNSVRLFAYPYGDDDAGSGTVGAALRDAGYHAAFLYGGGVITLPVPDPYRIERIPIVPETDLRDVLNDRWAP